MEKINLNDGTYVTYETFVGFTEDLICDMILFENQLPDFWLFVKDKMKKHFNYFIDKGYGNFCFEGIDVLLSDEVQNFLAQYDNDFSDDLELSN
jgi:hypothetical protein